MIDLKRFGSLFILCLLCLLLFACDEGPVTTEAQTPAASSPAVTFNAEEIIIPPTSPVTPRPGDAENDAAPETVVESEATTAATPTDTPLPTPTPLPSDRLALGLRYVETGNFGAAIEQLSNALGQGLATEQEQQARFALGQAYLATGQSGTAAEILNQFLAQSSGPQPTTPLGQQKLAHPQAAYALLARAYQAEGDGEAARDAYQTYLLANPEMAFYVQSAIADSLELEGDLAAAADARLLAVEASAHKNIFVTVLYDLGDYYVASEQYEQAAAQYLAILEVALTDTTRGDALYQAGNAQLLAGNDTDAYELFERAFNQYPQAYTSYLGLVELVEAGIVVDEYQRGLVDFYAGAYQPALDAFDRYIQEREAISETVAAEVYLWQAYSYEGLGNITAAVGSLSRYGGSEPAAAALEQAQLYFRNDQWEESRLSYIEYADTYSQTVAAPEATWWAARLTEIFGDSSEAAERYSQLADRYPKSEDVPRALFRAGFLWENQGDSERATESWLRLQNSYPDDEFSAAAAIWLQRSGLDESALDGADNLARFTYYHLRASDISNGVAPFAPVGNLNLVATSAEQAEAEKWLREELDLSADVDLASPGSTILNDERLLRGWKLWELGLWELAKRELEAVRISNNGDAAATYQLALFFSRNRPLSLLDSGRSQSLRTGRDRYFQRTSISRLTPIPDSLCRLGGAAGSQLRLRSTPAICPHSPRIAIRNIHQFACRGPGVEPGDARNRRLYRRAVRLAQLSNLPLA